MAAFTFNLTDLFASTFGYTPSNIKFTDADGSKNVKQTGDQSGDIRFTSSNLVNKKSEAGMYGSYYAKDIRGRDVFMPLTLGGYFLPYVWLNIKGTKRVVETPMTDRDGSVLEIIAIDNFQIGVKGFAIKHDGTFPEGCVTKNEKYILKANHNSFFLVFHFSKPSSVNPSSTKLFLKCLTASTPTMAGVSAIVFSTAAFISANDFPKFFFGIFYICIAFPVAFMWALTA